MTRIDDRPVSVVLVGIAGMGHHYLKTLWSDFPSGKVNLCGIVDPYPERSPLLEDIKKRSLFVFPSMKQILDTGVKADLVVIASPLQYHVSQSLDALGAGSHVLCEKPLAGTVQDADRLIKSRQTESPWIRIGYQWSYSQPILELKKDILRGRFGRFILAKALYLWPRDWAYYHRNEWAGRIRDSEHLWVLDSPANSAMAHDLHNLLFLLGERLDRSAQPAEVEAELYRAYPIENYDTAACRIRLKEGGELLFYASHVTSGTLGPFFSLEFERGSVRFGEERKEIVATCTGGEVIKYGSPENENPFKKLFESVDAVHNPNPVVCGPEAARSQTLCVNGIQDAVEDIKSFPESMLESDGKKIWVRGLEDAFLSCYKNGCLFYESGFVWAQKSGKINMDNYHFFPGGDIGK